jgi:sugar lactone lactonase YvrE
VSERSLQTLLEDGAFFEGPRWHEGRWWVSDFYRHLVLTVDPEGRTGEVLVVDGQPSGLGWMPDGSLLVVSMRDHRLLRWSLEAGVAVHADVSQHCGGHLNDWGRRPPQPRLRRELRLRPDGRRRSRPGHLIRVDPDGAAWSPPRTSSSPTDR